MNSKIKSYYYLTKPGIIYGNLLATVAGFLLASGLNIDVKLFFSTLLGTGLIIASSCVFNNYIDRDIDSKMKRTAKRALVTGKIPLINALIFGSILGFLGFLILFMFTNLLVVAAGLVGMLSYVIIYTQAKRKTIWGTFIGTIPGAMPPVAGYLAVTGKVDLGAVLIFLVLIFWQMAHFYAIGIFRLNDYKEANIPILPVKKGIGETRNQIIIFISLYLVTLFALSYFKYTGWVFLICMMSLGVYWLLVSLRKNWQEEPEIWARKVFKTSILTLMSFSVLLCLNVVLP